MRFGPNKTLIMAIACLVALITPTLQRQPAQAQAAALQILDQTPFVPADGVFHTELNWVGPVNDETEILATIWAPVSTEAEIFATPSEVRNQTVPIKMKDIERTERGTIDFTIDIRSFNDGDNRIWLEESGVYPVTIEVRSDAGKLASLRTNLIRLPTDIADIPLFPISVVLTVSSADGLELFEAIRLLENHPDLTLTVLLEDGLLPQLQSDPELAARFVRALGHRTVVAGSQLNLDPSALASIGQPEFYDDAIKDTRRQFAEVGLRLEPTILPLDIGITNEGTSLLISLGIEIVIDLHTAAGSLGSITSDNGELTVVHVDDERTAILLTNNNSGQPSLTSAPRAHQLLALLAVRYQTDLSPVMLGGSGLQNVDLGALEVVLEALDQGLMMEATSMSEAALSSRTLPFRPQELPDQNLGEISQSLQSTQALLSVYSDFQVVGGPSPESIQARLIEGLSRDLNPEARFRAIAAIEADLETQFNVISLPEGPTITLAAQKSEIPLTLTNSSSGVRLVRIRFESDRLLVAEDDQEFLLQPGESQIPLNIEARSLGVSTLVVTVLTPDGSRELATTRFAIRNTAIPGLGYVLSGTALLFLVIWWFRSISRTRAKGNHPSRGPIHLGAALDDQSNTTTMNQ